ncbi:hypothetical protein DL769_006800 [Monosporascus sp. CRB-8-3]|nr:hypothetical protein DL769_006800 [Monosporascus sp. CRB-8-3]
MTTTLNVSGITRATKPPVEQPASDAFLGWSMEDVIKFAKEHIDRWRDGIVPDHLVVLDKQTMKDKETCLLVTPKKMVETEGERIIVRADFCSSFTLLNVRIMGCGGMRLLRILALMGFLYHSVVMCIKLSTRSSVGVIDAPRPPPRGNLRTAGMCNKLRFHNPVKDSYAVSSSITPGRDAIRYLVPGTHDAVRPPSPTTPPTAVRSRQDIAWSFSVYRSSTRCTGPQGPYSSAGSQGCARASEFRGGCAVNLYSNGDYSPDGVIDPTALAQAYQLTIDYLPSKAEIRE